ncbi:hypothetical protein [Sphingobium chungbukense]|nr:hypothetical protein [Sphingobium chungbukense]
MVFATPSGNATAIGVGDLVTLAGTSQIINGVVYNDVVQGATGNVFAGVVVGFLPDTRDSLPYRAASTVRLALVNVDPQAEYEIRQVAGGTPLNANDVGLNANVVVGSVNTSYGWSGMALDNTTEATTNTLDLKITGMSSRPDNEVGTSVSSGSDSSTFFVRINRHLFSNQVAGV